MARVAAVGDLWAAAPPRQGREPAGGDREAAVNGSERGSGFGVRGSRFEVRGSGFRVRGSGSRLPVRLPVPGSCLPGSRLPVPDSCLPSALFPDPCPNPSMPYFPRDDHSHATRLAPALHPCDGRRGPAASRAGPPAQDAAQLRVQRRQCVLSARRGQGLLQGGAALDLVASPPAPARIPRPGG